MSSGCLRHVHTLAGARSAEMRCDLRRLVLEFERAGEIKRVTVQGCSASARIKAQSTRCKGSRLYVITIGTQASENVVSRRLESVDPQIDAGAFVQCLHLRD